MEIDLVKAFKMIGTIIGLITTVVFGLVIAVIVLGVLINAVTGGSITLSTNLSSYLAGLDNTIVGWLTSFEASIALVIGLIAVVVILGVFGYKKLFGGSGKGGSRM